MYWGIKNTPTMGLFTRSSPMVYSCGDKHLTLTSSINQKSAVRILSYAQRREHAIVYQPVHINTTIIIYSQVFTKYEK